MQQTEVFEEPSERSCDFEVLGLRTGSVEIAVVPELGAKIIRLQDRRAGREWLWSASPDRKLFCNRMGDNFETGPLVGIDECIPTVVPCRVGSVDLPDHGEAWIRPWDVDRTSLAQRHIVTELGLKTRPLRLTRRLTLEERTLHLDYELQNRGADALTYVWALHPLIAMQRGDRLEIPGATSAVRVGSAAGLSGIEADQSCAWPEPRPGVRLDALDLGDEPASIKLFLPTSPHGQFAVVNGHDATRLGCRYGPADVLPFVGVWITRGAWHGHHHLAVEPTNVDHDCVASIEPSQTPAANIKAGETRRWFVEFVVGQ